MNLCMIKQEKSIILKAIFQTCTSVSLRTTADIKLIRTNLIAISGVVCLLDFFLKSTKLPNKNMF